VKVGVNWGSRSARYWERWADKSGRKGSARERVIGGGKR